MSIFNFKENGLTKKLQGELNQVKNNFRVLKFEMQGFIDALSGEESASGYSNNNYRDYARAVQSVSDKYENGATWGNGLTANIVDFRAAVTVSSGPQYKPKMDSTIQQKDESGKSVGGEDQSGNSIDTKAEAEMDFCRSFFEVNDINHETPQEWGREGEIEGRVAVGLDWDGNQVVARHYPWLKYRYEEIRSKINPKTIESIKWAEQTDLPAGELKGDQLVCRRFSGRNSAKYPTTKVIRILTQIEYVDQAFRDWREINRLYASPIPVFECKTVEEAEEMNTRLQAGLNFKIKKAWALLGTFKFAGPDMTGIDSLEKEILRQSCFIAGTTGYPLQFLLPDMLSNRSTSENIMESALIHTASERAIWTGFYEELISKAMIMYSAKTSKTALDPNKLEVSISLMTEEQWQRLISFWLPAFEKDLVTREAVLPQIPNFNVGAELDRRNEVDKTKVAEISAELDKVQKESALKNQDQNNKDAGTFPLDKTPGNGQEAK